MRKLDHNIMKCYSLRIPILGKGRKSNIHGGCLYVRCEPNGLILIRTSVLVRTKVLTGGSMQWELHFKKESGPNINITSLIIIISSYYDSISLDIFLSSSSTSPNNLNTDLSQRGDTTGNQLRTQSHE